MHQHFHGKSHISKNDHKVYLELVSLVSSFLRVDRYFHEAQRLHVLLLRFELLEMIHNNNRTEGD